MKPIDTTLYHRIREPRQPSEGTRPAVILLHGRGADENDLIDLAPFLDPRLLLISARAPHPFPYGGFTWYDMVDIGKPEPDQCRESLRSLSRFVADCTAGYALSPASLFLFGFSMGSMMSLLLGATEPSAVRGVAGHSGYLPEGLPVDYRWDALGATSFFVAHGSRDPVVPVALGRRTRDLLNAHGATLAYHEYPIEHTISEESLADAVRWMEPLIVAR